MKMQNRTVIRWLLCVPLVLSPALGCNAKSNTGATGTAKPGEPGTPDLGEMMKLLKTGDEKGKRLACVGLGRLGAAAKDAIPDLEKIRSTAKDGDLKRMAGETIEKIQSAK